MKYSEIQEGDVIVYTTAHGRIYKSTVTRVGYTKMRPKNLLPNSPMWRRKMYSFECEGHHYEKEAHGSLGKYESVWRDGVKIH